jgi:hypothetical protein
MVLLVATCDFLRKHTIHEQGKRKEPIFKDPEKSKKIRKNLKKTQKSKKIKKNPSWIPNQKKTESGVSPSPSSDIGFKAHFA